MKRNTLYLTIIFLLVGINASSQVSFKEIGQEVGINELGLNHGATIIDFDQDGWEDIYVSRKIGPNRLYKNLGENTFIEIAAEVGLNYRGDSRLAIWGDINNDSHLDVFISTYDQGDKLFLNKGDDTFEDISEAAGMSPTGKAIAAVFGDIDNDGYLDLYCARHYAQNTLYRNLGANQFADITLAAGTVDTLAAMGALFFDYDNDNDQDLYLVRDAKQPNILYQNDGTGNFIDISAETKLDDRGFGMGAAANDINHDGWLDIYVTNLYYNSFYLNNGDGTFSNIADSILTNDRGVGWGVSFLDATNDGLQDIYITNTGYYSSGLPSLPNILYQNNGNLQFTNISQNTSLASTNDSYGMATGDLNKDGKVDFIFANSAGDKGVEYFQNQSTHNNHWMSIRTHGIQSNRAGIGTRVEVKANGIWQTGIVSGGSGWASQNSLTLYFGLGKAEKADSVTVKWPSGKTDFYTQLAADKHYNLTETISNNHNGNLTSQLEVRAQPNPFKEELSIILNLSEASKVNISLLDLNGKMIIQLPAEVLSSGVQTISFANLNLSPGVYVCQIETSIGNQVLKVMVAE